MDELIEEGLIKGAIDSIPIEKVETLLYQMKNCICKIIGKLQGTGCFCKIPYEDKFIPVLMTNFHVIDDTFIRNNKQIVIYISEKKIILDINKNKKIYSNHDHDIFIIKISEDDKIKNFLEIDENIFIENSENSYKNENIYILHYPNEGKASISFGYVLYKNDNEINHFCNIERGSSGGPILSLLSNKIIGIYKGTKIKNNENLYNLGKFLKFPLNDLKNIIIENNLDLEDKLFNHNKINIIKENKDDFSLKFHLDGLNKIKSGKLKNEEIIDFINKDKYFLEDKYANQNYRKLDIVEGLDFDNMNDNFFKVWEESNIFEKYSFLSYDFKCKIIDQIKNMKYFGKMLKLFNYKDKNIFDNLSFEKLNEKFKNIISNYIIVVCPTFIEDISFFIYIVDYQKTLDINNFLQNTIEKFIISKEIKVDIYIYLVNNYKNLSIQLNNILTELFQKNLEILNAKNMILLLERINSENMIESLLNKAENLIIKEEELFNSEKNIESFNFLEGIQKGGLIEKLNKTKYLTLISETKENILKKINNGEINFNTFKNLYIYPDKRNIFKEKLNILLFYNNENFEKYMEFLKVNFISTIKELRYIKILKSIFEKFFPNYHKIDIIKLETLENIINSGLLNEIKKPKTRKMIDEIHKILSNDEFNRMNILKNSLFFLQLIKARKYNNTTKDDREIFEEANNDFNVLKLLFEDICRIEEIPKSIMMECLKSLKNKKNTSLENEITTLIKIFQVKDFDENKILTLKGIIEIYYKKEKIFLTTNISINFIEELEAEKTNFYKELNNIKQILSLNLNINKTENAGNVLEKFELKINNLEEDDKDYLIILECLYNQKDLIKFIENIDEQYIKNIQEKKNKLNNYLLTNEEIEDLIECSKFIKSLGEIKGKKTDLELIQDFIKAVEKTKNISINFQNSAMNKDKIIQILKIK